MICVNTLALVVFASVSTSAFAAEPIALPFSKLPAFPAPALQLNGLAPAVAANVKSALSDAAKGNDAAHRAEAAMRAAEEAAAKGRAAARTAEALTLMFDGASCRYRGESKLRHAEGVGVMACGAVSYAGGFRNDQPEGPVVMETPEKIFSGEFRMGKPNGLGTDTARHQADAYQGEYRDGARMGFGVERDKDGAYPGRFGFYADPGDKTHRIDMALSGRQDFATAHWAGRFGAYLGPRIACTVIKGAFLEGSVLDGHGAKFDGTGKPVEQGLYATGLLKGATAPPC
ncbi:MAG: hypothetical protein J0H61_13825 [Alphaproteobacteria bacterium]|nr:hypothetical protein [Alphaproteobacteria bacterium]